MNRRWMRSTTDKALYGVCGGIAAYYGVSSLVIRVIFLMAQPGSTIIYALLAYYLPKRL